MVRHDTANVLLAVHAYVWHVRTDQDPTSKGCLGQQDCQAGPAISDSGLHDTPPRNADNKVVQKLEIRGSAQGNATLSDSSVRVGEGLGMQLLRRWVIAIPQKST